MVHPEREEREHACREGRAAAGGPARKVLVVDDNRLSAESMGWVLKLLGNTVAVAHSGPEALERVRQEEPDVVLCDIGLPGMDGYEVARALRQSAAPHCFLVALTGYASPEDRERALEAGFDAHLAKPAKIEVLESLLNQAHTAGEEAIS